MAFFSDRRSMAYPELPNSPLPPGIFGGHQPIAEANVDALQMHTPTTRNANTVSPSSHPGYYPAYATLDGPHWRVFRQFSAGVNTARLTSMTETAGDRSTVNNIRLTPPRIPRRGTSPFAVRNGMLFESANNYGDARVQAIRGLRR